MKKGLPASASAKLMTALLAVGMLASPVAQAIGVAVAYAELEVGIEASNKAAGAVSSCSGLETDAKELTDLATEAKIKAGEVQVVNEGGTATTISALTEAGNSSLSGAKSVSSSTDAVGASAGAGGAQSANTTALAGLGAKCNTLKSQIPVDAAKCKKDPNCTGGHQLVQAADQLCDGIFAMASAASVNTGEFGVMNRAAESVSNAVKGISGSGIPTAIGAGLLGAGLGGAAGYMLGKNSAKKDDNNKKDKNDKDNKDDKADPSPTPSPTPTGSPTPEASPTATASPTPSASPSGISLSGGTIAPQTTGANDQVSNPNKLSTDSSSSTTPALTTNGGSTLTPRLDNTSGTNRDASTTKSASTTPGTASLKGAAGGAPSGGSGGTGADGNGGAGNTLSLSSAGSNYGAGDKGPANGPAKELVGFDVNSFGADINGTRKSTQSIKLQNGGRAKALIDLKEFCAKNPKHQRCGAANDPLLQR